jgi:hypothetical protein
MNLASLEAIFRALQRAQSRYLVVGGLAVMAHGYQRFTNDLDLVLDFSPDSMRAALEALRSLDYGPRIPVNILDFANPDLRKEWQKEKGMKVFNVFSPRYPDVTINLFPSAPFSFEAAYREATWHELAPGLKIPIVSLKELISMKKEANRPQDQIDVDKLQKIRGLSPNESQIPDFRLALLVGGTRIGRAA